MEEIINMVNRDCKNMKEEKTIKFIEKKLSEDKKNSNY